MVAKCAATLWKDTLTASSYRMSFLFQFVGPLFMILSFFFLSRLLEEAPLTGLSRYGGDYFSFVLVGLVFTTFTALTLSSMVSTIRKGQTTGTLELLALGCSPTPMPWRHCASHSSRAHPYLR